jgi:threonine dehydrogenase-like Zn-dependent dehydrogenase
VIRERQEHGRAWRGLFDARKLVTPRFKFDEAKNALETFPNQNSEAIKIIIGGIED